MKIFILIISTAFSNFAWSQMPSVSGNALFLYQSSNFHKEKADPANPDESPNGLRIREMELLFVSDVDAFTKLNINLAIHPEYESDGTEIEETWKIEPEEAYVVSSFIPLATVKLGKFKAAMGNHNLLHTHEFAFIHAPLANSFLLGDEGLNDVGLSGAFLLPTSWLTELTVQYFRGEGENEQFKSPSPNDGVGLVHFKNLWNVHDDTSLELGASYAQGKNSYSKGTSLVGADLTLKWQPDVPGRFRSWLWTVEYLSRVQEQAGVKDEVGKGYSTWFQYQFSQVCTAQYRFDHFFMQDTFDALELPNNTMNRHSFALTFFASKASSVKVEYSQSEGGPVGPRGQSEERAFFVQGNFTLGSHAGHSH